MSAQASLMVDFDAPVDAMQIIDLLIGHGWEPNDNGKVSYLPLGDDDSFDWHSAGLDQFEEIKSILQKKREKSEIIGLSLTWRGSQIGGEFLFYPDHCRLDFCVTINRVKRDGTNETCWDWYMEKIISPIKNRFSCGVTYSTEQVG